MERWLLEVEEMMVQSLKDVTVRAVESHPSTPHEEWVTLWPAQVILIVAQIVWTAEVVQLLENSGLQVKICFV